MGRLGNLRLLELADHLESDQRGHDQFSFILFSTIHHNSTCGTAGCALGECPFAFPNDWGFTNGGSPRLKEGRTNNIFQDADKFFELPGVASSHLFAPNDQAPNIYGGVRLPHNATAEEVAGNIRAYVKKSSSPWGRLVMSVKGNIAIFFR